MRIMNMYGDSDSDSNSESNSDDEYEKQSIYESLTHCREQRRRCYQYIEEHKLFGSSICVCCNKSQTANCKRPECEHFLEINEMCGHIDKVNTFLTETKYKSYSDNAIASHKLCWDCYEKCRDSESCLCQ